MIPYAKGIYFPHRQLTAIIANVGSLCRVLRVLPFRDIVLEWVKLPPDLLSAFPIGPRSIIQPQLDSNVAYQWRISYSMCLEIFNLEDGIFILYGSFRGCIIPSYITPSKIGV